MAQNATTVTASNPTPPTNTSSIGWTAPDPSFFANSVYYTSVAVPGQGTINDIHYPYGGPGVIPQVTTAPYFDDGFSNTPLGMTWNETGGVSGTTAPSQVNPLLFVAAHAVVTDSSGPPVITSQAPESLGLEVNGNVTQVAPVAGGTAYSHVTKIAAAGQVMTAAIREAGPNASHASSLSPTTVLTPTTSAASGANNVANGTATLLTVTGTNFNRTSVVYIDGVAQPTNYASATSLTVTNAIKRSTSGNMAVTVKNTNSGITSTPATNWVQS